MRYDRPPSVSVLKEQYPTTISRFAVLLSKRVSRYSRGLLMAVLTVGIVAPALADDWPQFRGPEANATSPTPLPVTWSDADGKMSNVRWKIPIAGEGWSQPIVSGGRIYLTAAIPQSANSDTGPEPYAGGGGRSRDDLTETFYEYQVICFDSDSGKEIWRTPCKVGPPPIPRHSTNTYATETPVTDGKRIYAYFGMNGVYALDMQGKVLWQKDLGVYEMRADWGTASSPVLFNGRLFVQVDNQINSFMVALDTESGDEIWRVSRDEKSQYSSPMIWKNSRRNELVAGGMVYRSYDPATGDLLWQLDMAKGRSSATPISDGDRLFIGNELRNRGGDDDGGGRFFCVKQGGNGDITPADDEPNNEFVDWWIEKADLQMASPTLCQGRLYLFERQSGNMHCIDAADGQTVYRKRVRGATAFWASPWTDGQRVYALDADGTTHVLAAGDDYDLLSANELGQQTWGTPALADSRIYLRTVDHLYCIEDLSSPAAR